MSKTSVELLRGPVDEDDEPKKIYGVVTATVGPQPDPLFQGRVQVMLHSVDCLDMSAFARVATLSAGKACGTYFVPQPGDEVLVAFEHGNVNSPFIIGSLWSLAAPPPLPTQLAQIRAIRTQLGNQIVFSDVPPSITIQTSAAAAVPGAPTGTANIVLSPVGIQMTVGTSVVFISQAAIVLQCGNCMITLTEQGIQVASGGQVGVSAMGNIMMTSPEISLLGPKGIKLNSP